ncbi:hypothetical protein ET445_06205 [Agromyces protaetiae]|uniref:Uncharacterized protein n=1 Tax=Agromyces protaetiae TaxID=2509455 RepID=A0A4P6FGM3_9MICO|nr:hypothetical protein [Agromyces protaetiae]QAY72997.1 hypothetical protein ET445_06205 [Agromyces protaetiae]
MTDHEHPPHARAVEPAADPRAAKARSGHRRRFGWIIAGASAGGIALSIVAASATLSVITAVSAPALAAGASDRSAPTAAPESTDRSERGERPVAPAELPVTLDWDVEIGRPADAYTVKVFSPPGWAIVDEVVLGVQGQEEAESGCRLWVQQGELPDEVKGIADDREATLAYLGWISHSEVLPADVEEDVFTAFPEDAETEVPESEQYASAYWLRVASGERQGFVKARVFAELEQVVVVSALCPAGITDLEPIRHQAWSHVAVMLMDKQ